jgi:hypothetical protein
MPTLNLTLMLMLMLMLTPLLLTPARSLAQGPTAPDLLPYQGTLVNGDGEPLGMPSPRNYDVVFRIFDASSGGNLVWSEQQTVTVDNGRFSVQLGQGAAFEAEPRPAMGAVFRAATASDRYLETTVKGVGSGGVDSTLLVRTRTDLRTCNGYTHARLTGASGTLNLSPAGFRARNGKGQRLAIPAGHLRLIGQAAMFHAIGKAGVHLFTAKMEIGLTGVTQRPFADAIVEIEQRGFVRNFRAGPGRHQTPWRRGRRRCGLFPRVLTDKATRAD